MLKIVTPREIVPEAQILMEKHGCVITAYDTYSEVCFPEGTTRKEILPRMQYCERFTLMLPGGYVMQQTWSRLSEQSALFCTREDTR